MEFPLDPSDHLGPGVLARHVVVEEEGAPADLVGQGAALVVLHVGDHHGGALAGQGLGAGPADAARGAGDDGRLAFQSAPSSRSLAAFS